MKPVVYYVPDDDDSVALGQSALLMRVLNHPGPGVSNTKPIHTSPVVAVHMHGRFETRNTYYVPIAPPV